MSISSWLGLPRVRRGLAASAVVLAAGGTILYRAGAGASAGERAASQPTTSVALKTSTPRGATFSGAGADGTVSLSHAKVLAGGERQLFVELKLRALTADSRERAPLAMAVVLDTSGSMSGDKIQQAKDAVIRLARDMRDDDEISLVRYSDEATVVQPLARVGAVRDALIANVRNIRAAGGTAIPRGLDRGLATLSDAERGRVRRVVLVSDGLDATRAEAEWLASTSFERGIVVSSIGIGLDFDEGYMASLARAGHGNFAFVENTTALAKFLRRELLETAATTLESATARLHLPKGIRFVRAYGADPKAASGDVELTLGSLFSGDERRVVVELAANLAEGEVRAIEGEMIWTQLGGAPAEARLPALEVRATEDERAVTAAVDDEVLADATSVLASTRTLEAADEYNKGNRDKAKQLIDQNVRELSAAAAHLPAPRAASLNVQMKSNESTAKTIATAAPSSDVGKATMKRATHDDLDNTYRAGAAYH